MVDDDSLAVLAYVALLRTDACAPEVDVGLGDGLTEGLGEGLGVGVGVGVGDGDDVDPGWVIENESVKLPPEPRTNCADIWVAETVTLRNP
jgi:hypothetical protein